MGAGEHVVSEKLRGAVVELCGEEEEVPKRWRGRYRRSRY